MRPIILLPSLSLLLLLVACSEDAPTKFDNPCSGTSPVAASNGFRIDGAGYTDNVVSLDSIVSDPSIGIGTSFTNVGVGSDSMSLVQQGADIVVREGDTALTVLSVRFPGRAPGVYNWDNVADGNGSGGVSVSIVRSSGNEVFRAVSGATVVTEFQVNASEIRISGSFCGMLKDSTGRTVTISGGRFTTQK